MKTARPRLAIALISAAVIAYEVLLMALFSLIQWHHFAYLVVSVALLGFGASGSFLVFARAGLRHRFRDFGASQACLFALAAIVCFALAQRLSFNPEELIWDRGHWLRLALVILLLSLPFFFAANLIGLALIEFRQNLSRIYAADLIGAGTGAAAIVLLLYQITPDAALRAIALLGLAAGGVLWVECGGRRAPVMAALVLAALVLYGLPASWTDTRVSPYKEMSQVLQLPGTRVVEQRYSPFGMLSVVESKTIPFRHAPGMSLNARSEPPPQLGLFTNAGAMAAITQFDGGRARLAYLDDLPSALPYHLQAPGEVLILGAGGGADILQAYFHAAGQIDAVELDPLVIELVRGRFDEFSGGLLTRENVRIQIAEARGFLQRNDRRYDLIQVPLLDSFATAAAGVHGLNENYLYTVETLQLALSRLDDGGYLALTRWVRLPPRDGLKLFATAIAVLERDGVADAGQRLLMIRGLQTSTLVIKNGVVTAAEIERMKQFSSARAFDLVYYPGMPASEANRYNRLDRAYFHSGVRALLGAGREQFMRDYKFNLEPATDDRPFYFHFVKWSALAELIGLRHRGGSALLETGYLTLLVTLLLALGSSLLLILVPLIWFRRESAPGVLRFGVCRVMLYFTALGLGFLLLEIAFLQKLILLLHHPLYTAALVLSSFLVAAGLGSARAQAHAGTLAARRKVTIAVTVILVLGGIYLLALEPLIQSAASWPLAARIGLVIGLIAPLGFCMGMPFPLGLAAVSLGPPALTPWAWGLNGCASVISAVLATLLAIHFGFNAIILLALTCYAAAAATYPIGIGD